jgi:two-component system sensor histidine kinase MprB
VDAAARRTPRSITLDVRDASPIVGRSKALTRAVSNLVDNAIKHGADGPVEVSVHGTTFEVRDHGPGIPPADLPKIFDRFYRADVARTEPGSGLGLAIVAQVVERHGGTVFARNHPDGGAVVGFTL